MTKLCKSACFCLALALCLGLAGCAGTRSNTSSRTSSVAGSSSAVSSGRATPTPGTASTASGAGSAASGSSSVGSGASAGELSSVDPNSPPPSEEITGGDDLKQLYETVKATYGDAYYPTHLMDNAELMDTFDLEQGSYTEFIADTSETQDSRDMLVIIRAVEGQEQAVEDKLNAYRDAQLEQEDGPMHEKIEASKVYRNGLYVFYVMLGEAEDDTLSGEGLVEALGKEVDKGLDALREFFSDRM